MDKFRYIIMTVLIAGTVSCNDRIGTEALAPIVFDSGLQTKAYLNAEDICAAGTELTVYGFNPNNFIAGKTASYDASEGWKLDKTYYWTSGKDHSFFAYLSKDKDGHDITSSGATIDASGIDPVTPGSSVTPGSTRSLKITKTFDFAAADNNFDFCYSDVVYRPGSNEDHSVVNLTLNHLYTAIAFSAHNYTSAQLTIEEVSLVGLKNEKSATIAFANDGTTVSYADQATWTSGVRKLNTADIAIAKDAGCANIIGEGTAAAQYFMFWPQTAAELEATGWTSNTVAPTGGAYLKVVYNQGGTSITRYARFPQDNDGSSNLGWPAGTKRLMEIAFRDDYFTLNLQALPWDYSEPSIKYAVDDTDLSVESPLQFDESTCTVDEAAHTLYFKGGNPITGSFKLTSPEGATWIISKEGDYDAFEVDNVTLGDDGLPASRYGDKMDCNYGAVDVTNGNTFTIYPMAVAAGKDYSIQISFSIRYPNGESYCIDELLQPAKWTVVLTK